MTKPQPETSAVETITRSDDSPAPGDESKSNTRATDSDTQHSTDPKGSGLGAEPKAGPLRSDGGGGPDTGGGDAPKTGLEAQPKPGHGTPEGRP